MRTFLRISLGSLIVLAILPSAASECPKGTRNNYKGECVALIATPENDQVQQIIQEEQKAPQDWVEPTTDKGEEQEEVLEQAATSKTDTVIVVVEEVSATVENVSTERGVVEEVSAIVEDASTETGVVESLPTLSVTTDLASAMSTIQKLREEIEDLLNRVELQRYEIEKLRGRQRDLYDDLDQRLRKQERLALSVPLPDIPSVDSVVSFSEVVPSNEPAPMVATIEQSSPSSDSMLEGVADTDVAVTVDAKEDEPVSPTASVTKETVVAASQPAPMVAGTDLPAPNPDSHVLTIVQQQKQIGTQEQTNLEKSIVFEDEGKGAAEVLMQVPTVMNILNETEINGATVKIKTSTTSDMNNKQLNEFQRLNTIEEEIVLGMSSDNAANEDAVVVTSLSATTVSLSEQDAYDQAFNMLKQSRYEDAAEEFANFLREYRNSQLTDDAWYWMAEAHYVMRDFERALIAFNTVVSYFVNSPRIPASRLKIGYIQYEMANYPEARVILTQLFRDFPAHRVAVSAEARLKRMDREGR